MEKYTRQIAFSKAYLGLKAQGFERAYDEARGCVYRTDDGKKCAFGHLIPDELYDKHFERKSVSYFFNSLDDFNDEETKRKANHIATLFDYEDKEFLRELQKCHDDSKDAYGNSVPAIMKAELERFAFEHNLTIPVEDSEQEEVKA